MTTARPRMPVNARLMPHAALRRWVTDSLERRVPGSRVSWETGAEFESGDAGCVLEVVVPVTTAMGHMLDLGTARLKYHVDNQSSGTGPPIVYAAPLSPHPGPLSFRAEFMNSLPGRAEHRSVPGWMRVMTLADITEVTTALSDRPITRLPWPGIVRKRPWNEFWYAWEGCGSARHPGLRFPDLRSGNEMTAVIRTRRKEAP